MDYTAEIINKEISARHGCNNLKQFDATNQDRVDHRKNVKFLEVTCKNGLVLYKKKSTCDSKLINQTCSNDDLVDLVPETSLTRDCVIFNKNEGTPNNPNSKKKRNRRSS